MYSISDELLYCLILKHLPGAGTLELACGRQLALCLATAACVRAACVDQAGGAR